MTNRNAGHAGARIFFAVVISALCASCFTAASWRAEASKPVSFPVAAHSNVGIEWWYLNTHVTTKSGRHLAIVASFFRLGSGAGAGSKSEPADRSHYLIYGVTNLSAKSHSAYSLADSNSLNLIQQLATLEMLRNPNDTQAQKLLALAAKDRFPPPTQLIAGKCGINSNPDFSAVYGGAAALRAVRGHVNTYRLQIGAQKSSGLNLTLTFAGTKPPMYVGGDGNTGIEQPDDMKYVSLTRCAVTGSIDTGIGQDAVVTGQGWFDHQWGNSWTTASVGWDWWGVQLADGRDILIYRLCRMDTGVILSRMATTEDATGHLTVVRDVTFKPDPNSIWQSPLTHNRYPLRWTIDIGNIELKTSGDVPDQEMPVLANKGAIWEGSVSAEATEGGKVINGAVPDGPVKLTPGVGYMELVGYGPNGRAPER